MAGILRVRAAGHGEKPRVDPSGPAESPGREDQNREFRGILGSVYPYTGSKSFFEAPHSGQTQESGIASKAVPGTIPCSGSPLTGS